MGSWIKSGLPVSRSLLRRASLGGPKAQLRTLIVAPKRRGSIKKKKVPAAFWKENVSISIEGLDMKTLEKKIEEVQQFTRDLKLEIAKKNEEQVKAEIGNLDEAIDPDSEDIDIIYNELLKDGREDLKSLPSFGAVDLFNSPAKGTEVPETVLERIGDSVKHIVVKEKQNWNELIKDVYNTPERLNRLPEQDIFRFLLQMKTGSLNEQSLALIDEMLLDANIAYNGMIYDFMMKQYAELGAHVMVQKLFEGALNDRKKASKYMFGHLIKAYSKSGNIERVNQTLTKMFEHGIEPSKKVYTNVLQMNVSMGREKDAEEVFQMMKFRSLLSQPDTETYNTMIQLCVRTQNVHKALDLYQELIDAGLTPTVFTFNCLAQVCSKIQGFYRRGWEFIHQIHELNMEPNVKTFEIMLRLAAKDSDLELARALYIKIHDMTQSSGRSAGGEALNYLMVAYRSFNPDQKPEITTYREGLITRRNILNMVDFVGLNQYLVPDTQIERMREKYPPMLPMRQLSPKSIIAESNAVWAFNVANDPDTLNLGSLQSYLKVAIELGDKEEFLRRYKQFTFANQEIDKNAIIIEQPEEIDTTSRQNDGLPPAVERVFNMNFKIERESTLYVTLLQAGKRFRDEELCQWAWTERGKFRRTHAYQSLESQKRRNLDFTFSKEMVYALIELKSYNDAVGVVMASTYFNWNFYALKPLYVALLEIGDKENAQIISKICSKNENKK